MHRSKEYVEYLQFLRNQHGFTEDEILKLKETARDIIATLAFDTIAQPLTNASQVATLYHKLTRSVEYFKDASLMESTPIDQEGPERLAFGTIGQKTNKGGLFTLSIRAEAQQQLVIYYHPTTNEELEGEKPC